MDIGDAAQWGATGVVFIALLFTIIKNGRGQKDRDEKIAKSSSAREAVIVERLKSIGEAVNSPVSGLAALKEDTNAMKQNCAKVTSGFTERIKSLEKHK